MDHLHQLIVLSDVADAWEAIASIKCGRHGADTCCDEAASVGPHGAGAFCEQAAGHGRAGQTPAARNAHLLLTPDCGLLMLPNPCVFKLTLARESAKSKPFIPTMTLSDRGMMMLSDPLVLKPILSQELLRSKPLCNRALVPNGYEGTDSSTAPISAYEGRPPTWGHCFLVRWEELQRVLNGGSPP